DKAMSPAPLAESYSCGQTRSSRSRTVAINPRRTSLLVPPPEAQIWPGSSAVLLISSLIMLISNAIDSNNAERIFSLSVSIERLKKTLLSRFNLMLYAVGIGTW
ncbi:hypothetical protein, partial [Mesotoga prima]|uniref:hypothetical protein n=1 Tax=Mesotoga prima TaxID=1184387 RepID=UPI002D1FB820